MTREHKYEFSDLSRIQAILAFDQALVTGGDPPATGDENSSLDAIYNCQRLLEEMWPRSIASPADTPRQFGRYIIAERPRHGRSGRRTIRSTRWLYRRTAKRSPPRTQAARFRSGM
jgi:hypothetical protein